MFHSKMPDESDLPSSGQILRSTLLALISAGLILVMVVMPAEYGIDPTGFGKLTGLKQMGVIKMGLEEEAAADKARAEKGTSDDKVREAVIANPKSQSHETSLTLQPNKATEVKLSMKKGAVVRFEWKTDGAPLYFDRHGDSKPLAIKYHKYKTGAGQAQEGTLVAAFDGKHGWYWKNLTPKPITLTLKTNGAYNAIEELK